MAGELEISHFVRNDKALSARCCCVHMPYLIENWDNATRAHAVRPYADTRMMPC